MGGVLVTVEGCDGAGKTSLVEFLAADLRRRRLKVLVTREPGGTALGEEVRRLLLAAEPDPLALTEALLYAASRAQLVGQVILPALKRGEVVLCDRFTDSTLAYQGWARGLPLAPLRQLNTLAAAGVGPDLTLLLDLPVTVGLTRAGRDKVPDRLEREGVAFMERVRQGYLELARQEPGRFLVLDATKPLPEVGAMALAGVGRLLDVGEGRLNGGLSDHA